MLDEELRKGAKPFYAPLAAPLANRMSGNMVSITGLAVGLLCLIAIALGFNGFALILWLANRLLDGLDGEVARLRDEASEFGSFLDITSDFAMYGGFLAALAIQHEEARLALIALLFAYYLNGTVFLALSSVLERLKAESKTERGLHFRRSLTEGFETIMFGVLALAFPAYISPIVWIFAAMVFVSAAQRILDARRIL